MSVRITEDPEINPIPEYNIPIIVKNIPMPTPLATLIDAKITLTSH